MNDIPRWHYRFANFSDALAQLREAAELPAPSKFEKIALVQLFNITFELAWKLLKDRMEDSGVEIPRPVFPSAVIKEAFAVELIEDGDAWMAMLDNRNAMAHLYDEKKFEEAANAICRNHLPALNRLHDQFRAEADK